MKQRLSFVSKLLQRNIRIRYRHCSLSLSARFKLSALRLPARRTSCLTQKFALFAMQYLRLRILDAAAQHKRRALNVSNSVESLCDDHVNVFAQKTLLCKHRVQMLSYAHHAYANGQTISSCKQRCRFPMVSVSKTFQNINRTPWKAHICNILFTRQLAQSNNSMTMKVPSAKCCCVSFLAMEARSVRLLCATSRWCEMKNHAAIAVHGARDLDGFGYMI